MRSKSERQSFLVLEVYTGTVTQESSPMFTPMFKVAFGGTAVYNIDVISSFLKSGKNRRKCTR